MFNFICGAVWSPDSEQTVLPLVFKLILCKMLSTAFPLVQNGDVMQTRLLQIGGKRPNLVQCSSPPCNLCNRKGVQAYLITEMSVICAISAISASGHKHPIVIFFGHLHHFAMLCAVMQLYCATLQYCVQLCTACQKCLVCGKEVASHNTLRMRTKLICVFPSVYNTRPHISEEYIQSQNTLQMHTIFCPHSPCVTLVYFEYA